ncbi:hypothetical protein A3Q56_00288 [Intoshia linei]|uniref:CUB domain-containing protein n=1 Tax=Intoshia linei TaxID=1819745 RepID=A0A177BEC4_9BILA|nr:hypothetical protein A3Q56_00288 [Intoshia linei]
MPSISCGIWDKYIDGASIISGYESNFKNQDCLMIFRTKLPLGNILIRFERFNIQYCNVIFTIWLNPYSKKNITYTCDSMNVTSLKTDMGYVKFQLTKKSIVGYNFTILLTEYENLPTKNHFKCKENFYISNDIMCSKMTHCAEHRILNPHDCDIVNARIISYAYAASLFVACFCYAVCFIVSNRLKN